MMDGLLPLFPLELVLLPGTLLPLHIFEPRYREMIGECLAGHRKFGVVLQTARGVAPAGCAADVLEVVRRHTDGRLDILTMGCERFHLKAIHSTRSFLQGDVEIFDDDDTSAAPPQVIHGALALYQELARRDGPGADPGEDPPEPDHARLSFQLARIVPDLDFRQALLELRSEAARMERVAAQLALLVRRREVGGSMRKVARSNGHGKHLPNLANPE